VISCTIIIISNQSISNIPFYSNIKYNFYKNEAKFDAFYAEGVGLSWRKDADEEAMHFVEGKSGALPQKRVGADEEPTVHNVKLRDQRKMVKGMIPGAKGSVVNMEEIEEGDEVRAFFRVRGNKVKQVTGVVSEISQKGYVRLRTCGRWLKVVRKIASLEKCGGPKERTSKNKKINRISAKVGDTVTIMAGRSKRITGVVSAISKKGTVKLNQYGKWAKVMETNRDDATRDIWERDSEKKLRSRTESSFKESQRTLPLNVSTKQRSKENSVEIGDKVKIKTARSERKIGIVSAVSKKGTVKLDNYGRFSAVVRIIKGNDSIGIIILGREIQKKNQGHGPNPLSKDTIPHYQRITLLRARAGNDSVNGLIRRARNLILSISNLIRMSIPYVKVI